jgi:transposase
VSKVIMCGIDMHDNSLVCRTAVDRESAVTRRHANTQAGRQVLFVRLKELAGRHGCGRVVVAYEASSAGFCLYDDCRDAGLECFILAPTKMRKSRKDRKRKNDEHDAELILEVLRGHVLAGNALPGIWIPDDVTRSDRETVRARLEVGHKVTGVKAQVQMLLKAHRLRKPEDVGDSWARPHRRWLARLSMTGGDWPALATLLRQLAALEREVVVLDGAVAELSRRPRYVTVAGELVEQIKGVGVLTAMVFLTEMGDLSRFSNRRQVGAYLGLVPSSHDSGESEHKGHITREGSSRLRRVLCQATWSRVKHDAAESVVYKRLVQRNPKHKKIAVVAVMRRLGILMWHVGLAAQRKAGVFPAAQPDRVNAAAG